MTLSWRHIHYFYFKEVQGLLKLIFGYMVVGSTVRYMFPPALTNSGICMSVSMGSFYHPLGLSHATRWDSYTPVVQSSPAVRHTNYNTTVNTLTQAIFLYSLSLTHYTLLTTSYGT